MNDLPVTALEFACNN